MTARTNDITKLLPCFQPVVQLLLEGISKHGFSPILHETYRTPERAAFLAKDPDGNGPKQAPGIVDSMHCHGAAVDIICGKHNWDCRKHKCRFFEVACEVSTELGLHCGALWRHPDSPHHQAIPATPAMQDKLRGLKTWEEKDVFVRAHLKGASSKKP